MVKLYEQVVAFRGYFSPLQYNKYIFTDGGILNNLPVDEVRIQGAEIIIGVKFHSDNIENDSNLMDIVMKSIDIMGCKISEESLNTSDFVLDVYTDKTGLMDIDKLDKCYEYGYDAVLKNLNQIKAILQY